ncbi:hypothetical protein BVX94_02680 [bacterium B17]|nr:hypothetical protein BVX94_02680 [bacterium B17]
MRSGKKVSSRRSKSSEKKRGKTRRKLKVSARSGGRKKSARSSVIAVIITIVVILSATAVLVWLGLDIAGGMLFADNERFTIKTLVIKNGGPTVREFITGKKQISEGVNMFSFDIMDVRDEFLSRAPNYRSMEISRHLPDTLIVEVFERVPVVRVGSRSLVADREGYTFVSRSAPPTLPYLRKYDGPVRPGAQVTGMATAALELLEACDDPRMGIDIKIIEVDKSEYMNVDLVNGKRVKINWDNMGERTEKSAEELHYKLQKLAMVLRSEDSADAKVIDLTYENEVYAQ